MLFFILFLLAILISFCVADKNSRKAYIGLLATLICFPLGVILALAKKYK